MTRVEYEYVPKWFIGLLWLAVVVLAAYSFFSTLELFGISLFSINGGSCGNLSNSVRRGVLEFKLLLKFLQEGLV